MAATRFLILSAISYIGSANHDDLMELEVEMIEKCNKMNKCPVPGLKAYKSPNNDQGIDCIDGLIQLDNMSYPCKNMRLLSYLPFEDLGSRTPEGCDDCQPPILGNDLWGYTDKETKRLYGLTGQYDGASIVDVTNPFNPIPMIFIPSNARLPFAAFYRDIKVYKNYMYIVADGFPSFNPAAEHGMQYYNLDNLRDIDLSSDNLPIRLEVSSEDIGYYTEIGSCQNIISNEDSGYLYLTGCRIQDRDVCGTGLHIVDVRDPGNPTFAACFGDVGYISDGQCVTYNKNKKNEREICFVTAYDLLEMAVIDVTDKSNIFTVATSSYGEPGEPISPYQLWTTPNREYLLLGDLQLLEYREDDNRTRTYIFDIKDLENPVFIDTYFGTTDGLASNLYIDNKGKYAYLSNWLAGLRVLDITGLYNNKDETIQEKIVEVAYFDTNQDNLQDFFLNFNGLWSSYIYFEDFILLQTIDKAFFIVQPLLKGNKGKKGSSKKSDSWFYNDAIKSSKHNVHVNVFINISFLIITLCVIGYNIYHCYWKQKNTGYEDKVYKY